LQEIKRGKLGGSVSRRQTGKCSEWVFNGLD
jgi:hypothetical protein